MVKNLFVPLLVFLFFLTPIYAQEPSVRDVREALVEDLQYVSGLVTPEGGVSREFGPSSSLRAQVLVAQMAAGLHIGLGDPESLRLLNRIAAAVNSRIESEDGVDLGFDSGNIPEVENYITHILAANFLSTHYGLTKDLRSRSNMLKLVESIEKRLGWSPITSKAAYLLLSSRVSHITGGKPLADDVQESINEYSQRFTGIVDFSVRGGFRGLTASLSKLSLLMKAAHEAGLKVPTELVALWSVHIDYVVNQTQSTPVSSENYTLLLMALEALANAAENTHLNYSRPAADYAVKLAASIAEIWKTGDRILLLPVNVLDVYPLDPQITSETIVAELQKGGRVMMSDMRFPATLLVLEKSIGLPPELSSAVSLAIVRVSVKNRYYPLVEKGLLRSEEFVNRWWRVYLLATYLALQRAPAAQGRNEAVEIFFNTHPTFLLLLTLLLSIALAHRAGLLKW